MGVTRESWSEQTEVQRMQKYRRLLAVGITGVVLVGFAGCGNETHEKIAVTGDPAKAIQTSTTVAADTSSTSSTVAGDTTGSSTTTTTAG